MLRKYINNEGGQLLIIHFQIAVKLTPKLAVTLRVGMQIFITKGVTIEEKGKIFLNAVKLWLRATTANSLRAFASCLSV